MAYVKQTWADRLVEYAKRFSVVEDASGYLTLTTQAGTVTEAGTALDASRLNHMEDGIEDASNRLDDLEDGTVSAAVATLADNSTLFGGQTSSYYEKSGIESFTTATLANSWTNQSVATYGEINYYKDRGRVFLNAVVNGASATDANITTLAVGYRPARRVFGVGINISTGASVLVTVNTDGAVTAATGSIIAINMSFKLTYS